MGIAQGIVFQSQKGKRFILYDDIPKETGPVFRYEAWGIEGIFGLYSNGERSIFKPDEFHSAARKDHGKEINLPALAVGASHVVLSKINLRLITLSQLLYREKASGDRFIRDVVFLPDKHNKIEHGPGRYFRQIWMIFFQPVVIFWLQKDRMKDFANAQSKSVPARPTTVPSLLHTCFFCHHTE